MSFTTVEPAVIRLNRSQLAAPGVRTNIFTFVVHQTAEGWRCAAAHNTDVVPGVETHVVDAAGRLGAVDYRER